MALGFKLSATALPTALSGHECFAFNKRVFALGGTPDGSTAHLLIESAVVDQGGNINPFSVTAGLPAALNAGRVNFGFAQNPARQDLIYIVGGADPTGTTTSYVDVAIGRVNTDGSILWSVGPNLPASRAGCKAAIVGTWLYCIGGQTLGTATALLTNTSGTVALSATGNNVVLTSSADAFTVLMPVGTIFTISATSALAVSHAGNAGIYVVTTSTSTATTINATKLQDLTGGTLTAPVTTAGEAPAATTDLSESVQPISVTAQVLASKIQSDGSLGPWLNAGSIPTAVAGFNLLGHFVSGSQKYLYVGGGQAHGSIAPTQLIERATPEQGSGQNLHFDTEGLGLSVPRFNAGSPTLLLGRLIAAGGSSTALPAQAINTVDEVKLNSDGSIASALKESQLPVAIDGGKVVAINNQVLVVGGQLAAGTRVATIYQATLQDDLSF
jgi:hypothetical protein